MKTRKTAKVWALALLGSLLLSMAVSTDAQTRRNPEAGKKKAARRIGIGTAIGAGAGALINGKKGALIGAGIGAGSGGVYHVYKKRKARRHRRHSRRY